MNNKARVLITQDCNRNCPNCCAEYSTIMSTMCPCKVEDMANYDELLITGGEPMLYPEKVMAFIKKSKEVNPDIRIYLYTALWDDSLHKIIDTIDGIHFTLHIHADEEDIEGFNKFQELAKIYHIDKSFRVYIDPAVQIPITIYPWVYKRLEVKPWIMEGDCPLPEGEDLLRLTSFVS